MVSFALAAVGENALLGRADPNWVSQVLDAHNAARAQYGAGALTWSDALEPGTQQWAEGCQFNHR